MRRRDFIATLAGAVTLGPSLLSAQPRKRVIGYLHFAAPGYDPNPADFLRGLRQRGYVENQNIAIETRWAEGHYDRLPALAADLVQRNVDLIAAFGPPPAKAAKMATSKIPIVFEVGNDAVESGLVASLARPGANATGLNILYTQLIPKRLELLLSVLPLTKKVALLVNPKSPTATPSIKGAHEAAAVKGLEVAILNASVDAEIDTAFSQFAGTGAGGLIVSPDPFFDTRRVKLVEAAARHKVPTNYFEPEFSAVGGLISYGARLSTVYERMGVIAGQILDGAKPADIPVEQPTKFELAINVETAKQLGLNVPQDLLFTADQVIN